LVQTMPRGQIAKQPRRQACRTIYGVADVLMASTIGEARTCESRLLCLGRMLPWASWTIRVVGCRWNCSSSSRASSSSRENSSSQESSSWEQQLGEQRLGDQRQQATMPKQGKWRQYEHGNVKPLVPSGMLQRVKIGGVRLRDGLMPLVGFGPRELLTQDFRCVDDPERCWHEGSARALRNNWSPA